MIGNLCEEESSSHFSSDHAEFKASEEGNKPDNEVEDMSGEAEDGGDITVLRGEASTVIAVNEMKEGSLATGQMEVDIEDMSGEAEYGGHIPAEGVLRGEANTVIAVKEMTEEPGTAQMEVDIEDIEAVVPTEHVEGYNTWAQENAGYSLSGAVYEETGKTRIVITASNIDANMAGDGSVSRVRVQDFDPSSLCKNGDTSGCANFDTAENNFSEDREGRNGGHHVESVSSQEREEEAAGFEIILATQFPPQGGVNFIDNLR